MVDQGRTSESARTQGGRRKLARVPPERLQGLPLILLHPNSVSIDSQLKHLNFQTATWWEEDVETELSSEWRS